MMKPKDWIKRRHFQRRHVATPADAVVNLIVDVFQAAKRARVGVGIPSVEAEGVKVTVRQKEQANVAAERGQFVGKDGSNPTVLRLTGRVGIPNSAGVPRPLK